MSGAWAKACAQWRVDGNPEDAAFLIARVLWDERNRYTANSQRHITQAGATIRTWRKSLPEQGSVRRPDMAPHRDDDPDWDDDALLWFALRHVGYAQYHQPINVAGYLRQAEAALRTWWKRVQA